MYRHNQSLIGGLGENRTLIFIPFTYSILGELTDTKPYFMLFAFSAHFNGQGDGIEAAFLLNITNC